MTKASLTGILDVLESAGLIVRAADPMDRRKARVNLSSKGRRHCEEKMRELDEALEARMASLSGADRVALARHLAGATAILKKLEDH
jgi:DNA-binding MarR family transcriptional regulator